MVMNFSREHAEQNTYNDLVRLVQTADAEQVKKEVSMAFHLELITKEQLEKLCDLFNFVNDER